MKIRDKLSGSLAPKLHRKQSVTEETGDDASKIPKQKVMEIIGF
jgi:hypothetical protein